MVARAAISLYLGAGADTIQDFDTIEDFDNIDLIALSSGLTFAQLALTDNGDNKLIRVTATNELLATLNGVQGGQS